MELNLHNVEVTCAHFQTYIQGFVASQNRPKSTRVTRVIQGYETQAFKSKFDSWPAGSTAPGAEEGRGKVAGVTSPSKFVVLFSNAFFLIITERQSMFCQLY